MSKTPSSKAKSKSRPVVGGYGFPRELDLTDDGFMKQVKESDTDDGKLIRSIDGEMFGGSTFAQFSGSNSVLYETDKAFWAVIADGEYINVARFPKESK